MGCLSVCLCDQFLSTECPEFITCWASLGFPLRQCIILVKCRPKRVWLYLSGLSVIIFIPVIAFRFIYSALLQTLYFGMPFTYSYFLSDTFFPNPLELCGYLKRRRTRKFKLVIVYILLIELLRIYRNPSNSISLVQFPIPSGPTNGIHSFFSILNVNLIFTKRTNLCDLLSQL